jgi:beta-lactam-binding protein with PASTA domain
MEKLKLLLKNAFVKTILKIIGIIVLLIIGLQIWLGITTNHGQKIAVPDLSKMSLLKMKVALEDASLSYVIQDTMAFNPNYPPLTVIEQNPEFGEYVKEHRKIYIKLNPSGYRKIAIPKFYGKTKRQIEMQLQSIGFKIGTFSYVPDRGRNVVRGLTFKGKKLKVGDLIPKNSKINLILGDGRGAVAKSTTTDTKE